MKNTAIIIFGATGDLTKRKLIPGIYNLINHNRIKKFHIIGIARRPLSKEKMIDSSRKYIKNPDKKIISKLKANSSYVQVDFRNPEDYKKLKQAVAVLEKKGSCNKLFYLAIGSNN
ncbi:MAG: glucose-6-phosphate dehydrogenase, partial [Nanoarchaeota archaeon]|nr:glucose-6-phosphate dehydrogenase [Nanoarchaeota archaeon]